MFFRSALACASQPFLRWFRKTGMAIAARMPMMMMTTRSSIRVKPWSFSSMDLRRRASMVETPVDAVRMLALRTSDAPHEALRHHPGERRKRQRGRGRVHGPAVGYGSDQGQPVIAVAALVGMALALE